MGYDGHWHQTDDVRAGLYGTGGFRGTLFGGKGEVKINAPRNDPSSSEISQYSAISDQQFEAAKKYFQQRQAVDHYYKMTERNCHDWAKDAYGHIAAGGFRLPLILDLSDSGLQTVSKDQSNAFIDTNGDGKKERVGWDTQNSFLLYDADGDGKFTPQDMFLDKLAKLPADTPDGVTAEMSKKIEELKGLSRQYPGLFDGMIAELEALKEAYRQAYYAAHPLTDYDGLKTLDKNKDGKVDAKDAAWGKLATWRDKDGDGKIDPDELVRVNEPALLSGLLAINLNIDGKGFDDHGNHINGTFTVETADGKSHKGYDAGLAVVQGVEYVEGSLHVVAGTDEPASPWHDHDGKASDLHVVAGDPVVGQIVDGVLTPSGGVSPRPSDLDPVLQVGGGALSSLPVGDGGISSGLAGIPALGGSSGSSGPLHEVGPGEVGIGSTAPGGISSGLASAPDAIGPYDAGGPRRGTQEPPIVLGGTGPDNSGGDGSSGPALPPPDPLAHVIQARDDRFTSQEDQDVVIAARLLLGNDIPATQGGALRLTGLSFDSSVLVAATEYSDSLAQGSASTITYHTLAGDVVFDGAAQTLTYHTADYFYGDLSFTYQVADVAGDHASAQATLHVEHVNHAPTAQGERASLEENGGLAFTATDLLANDRDVDREDVLSLGGFLNVSHGAISQQADGSYLFQADAGYYGTAGFDYIVADGHGGQGIAHVDLDIVPVVPTQHVTTDEDTVLRFSEGSLLGRFSLAADPLSLTGIEQGSHGVASYDPITHGITFTADPYYRGDAFFFLDGQDEAGHTFRARIDVTYNPVNHAPIVLGERGALKENGRFAFTEAQLLANDRDVDAPYGDVLALAGFLNLDHGTIARQQDGSYVFQADAGYYGTAGYDYVVSDGHGGQSIAHVDLDIAPVVPIQRLTVDEDTVLDFTEASLLGQFSLASDPLSLTGIEQGSHGTAFFDPLTHRITFTADPYYRGDASFFLDITDQLGHVLKAEVDVTYRAVNHAPTATALTGTTDENSPLALSGADLLAHASDVDAPYGDVISLVSVGNASHGGVALDGQGGILFTPDAYYYGDAGFDYTIADNHGAQATGHVDLHVKLTALPERALTLNEGDVLHFTADQFLAGIENPDDPLTITGVTQGKDGTAAWDGTQLTFTTTDPYFYGTGAYFLVDVVDREGEHAQAKIDLTYIHINHAPTAASFTSSTDENIGLILTTNDFLSHDSDVDHDALTLASVGNASNGTVQLTPDGRVIFTPGQNYYGDAGFDYTIDDGHGGKATGHVDVTVIHHDIAPTIAPLYYFSNNIYHPVVSDPDDPISSLSFSISVAPHIGAVNLFADGAFSYFSFFNVPDSFTLRATDPSGLYGERTYLVLNNIAYPQGLAAPTTAIGLHGIVLDISGSDRLDLVSAQDSPLTLIGADHQVAQSGWVGTHAGLLTLADPVHPGQIVSPDQYMFSAPGAANDLQAVAQLYDSNHDGILNAKDDAFARFGLWRDDNQNGACDAGEWKSLAQLGIRALDLSPSGEGYDQNGNHIAATTHYTHDDGTQGLAGAVSLGLNAASLADSLLAQPILHQG
jgi:hypothetical protein